MRVLGIETSCDETGVAVYDTEEGLLAHQLHSQVDLQAVYGGVVPELASRDHVKRLPSLVTAALEEAGSTHIDGVAYTQGPGLSGALLTGAVFAKSYAYALGVPALGVHHLEGHLLAPMLEARVPEPPFLALLVSGGHTNLFAVESVGQYRLLGQSIDDAAGEAFDKTARLLGLPYPGGAALSQLARKGTPGRFELPRPLIHAPHCDFSFSGLKTAARRLCAQHTLDDVTRADIAHAFESAIVDVLLAKCARAAEKTGLSQIVVAGGVGANAHLRASLQTMADEKGRDVFFPRLAFCTDNGAMIAYAGAVRLSQGEQDKGWGVTVKPRWPLGAKSDVS